MDKPLEEIDLEVIDGPEIELGDDDDFDIALEVEVIEIPEGNVRKSERGTYYRIVEERVREWDSPD